MRIKLAKTSVGKKKFINSISIILIISLLMSMLASGAEFNNLLETKVAVTKNSPKIVTEIIEKRDKFCKTFLLDDNSQKAIVSSEAIHYKENGKWENIDNTLKLVTDETGNEIYENSKNNFNVKLPKVLTNGKSIIVEKDSYKLSFKLKDNINISNIKVKGNTVNNEDNKSDAALLTNFANKSSEIGYYDVKTNTDFKYQIKPEALKEEIVLRSKPDNVISYAYEIKAEGLTASLLDDNSIEIYNNESKSGEPVFVMPAPYMYDKNEIKSLDISVTLSNKINDIYILSYTPSYNWLIDEERTYPVIIDPTVQTSKLTSVTDDAYVSGTSSSGTTSVLYTGTVDSMRSYIKFNYLPTLNSSDFIINSKIYIYQSSINSTGEVDLYEVTGAWTETGVTSANAPSSSTTVTDYKLTNALDNSKYVSWDITGLARKWYLSSSTYGIVLKQKSATLSSTTYASSESSYCPYMEVTYKNYSGLESYWDYHQQNGERAGTGYVNDCNGNLVVVRDDIGYEGNRMPVKIQMVYNSNFASWSSTYGNGWDVNYHQTVSVINFGLPDQKYKYKDADGTIHYFSFKNEDNEWTDDDGLGLKLTEKTSVGTENEKYIISDISNEMLFNIDGNLIVIKNKGTTDKIGIEYVSGRIDIITDGTGRKYKFIYNSPIVTLNRIEYWGMGFTALKTVSYSYINTSYLDSVTYPDGNSVKYTYNNGLYNLLTSINDVDGSKVKYSYNSYTMYIPPRIAQVSLYGNNSTQTTDGVAGDFITISYGNNQTTFTNSKNQKEIKQFNNNGNTISTRDENGNAVTGIYSNTNDKLISISGLQNTSINQIINYSFEQSDTSKYNLTNNGAILQAGYPNFACNTEKHIGDKSLAVSLASDVGNYSVKQSVSTTLVAAPDKMVTFSAWVKTSGFSNEDEGAWITIKCDTFPTFHGEVSSDRIVNDIPNGEWKKLEASYRVPTGYSIYQLTFELNIGNAGIVYFDDLQAGYMKSNSSLSYIDNAEFVYTNNGTDNFPIFWSRENCIATDKMNSQGASPSPLDPWVYNLTGEIGKYKRVYQTIELNGNKGDNFVASAWAKAYAAPIKTDLPLVYDLAKSPATSERDFSILIKVVKSASDSTNVTEKTYRIPFNCYTNEWQYISGDITAEYKYSSIEVSIVYANEVNYVYFDGVALYKQNFGDKYTYDPNGNITAVTDISGSTTLIEYNENDLPVQFIDGQGNSSSAEYDDYKRVIKSFTKESVGLAFTYDDFGNVLTQSTTDGRVCITTNNTYDSSSNYLDKTTDSLGNTTDYAFDTSCGNLSSVTDAKGNTTNYNYDTSDRLDTTEKNVSGLYLGALIKSDYDYDAKGYLDYVKSNGTTFDFDYNEMGDISNVKVGTQSLISNSYYTSDKSWNLNTKTFGNGNTVGYTYDERNNVKSVKYNGIDKFLYNYDNTYTLIDTTDNVNEINTKYSYDGSGRITLMSDTGFGSKTGYKHTFGYIFDSLGRSSSLVESINGDSYTTNHILDKDGRNNGTWFEWGAKIDNDFTYKGSKEVRYDSLGRVSSNNLSLLDRSATTPTNKPLFWTYYHYTDKVDYKTTPQVYSMNMVLGEGQDKFDWTNYFTYDKNSNITGIDDIRISQDTRTLNFTTYKYDELNQLIRYNDQKDNKTWTYQYDAGGNIRNKKEYDYTTQADISGLTPIKTYDYSYGDTNWKDKLTSYDGKTITYDAIGNPLTFDGNTYTWEAGRQLATLNKTGTAISFKYNVNGYRTSKTVNGVTTSYTLIDDKVTYETNGTNNIYYYYDNDSNLVSFNLNGTQYFYIRNLQNDITGILDKDGNIVAEYSYDSWGKLISATGTLASTVGAKNPYRYRGYRYDVETGLYSLSSRYYDPNIGRFINADDTSILQLTQGSVLGANLFAYCGNNPVNNSDPTGYGPVGAIIGGILGFGLGLILVPYIANLLHLKGWGRTAFIWAGVAAITALGAYIGYYVGEAIFQIYRAGGALASKINEGIARGIARLVGASINSASGSGWILKVGKLTIRIMTESSYRVNYFRLSMEGKGAMTLLGALSSNAAATHINITISNIIQLVATILKFK